MSPRTAEEIYTKIPSCYPLGDDDGDADVLLDTILMQIDLDRKKGQMSPRDKVHTHHTHDIYDAHDTRTRRTQHTRPKPGVCRE